MKYPLYTLEIIFRGGEKLDICTGKDIRLEDIMHSKVANAFFRLVDRFTDQSVLVRWDDVILIREAVWNEPSLGSPSYLEAGRYNNGKAMR